MGAVSWGCSLAVSSEELVKQGRALRLEHPAADLRTVVETPVTHDVPERADGTGLGFPGPEHDPGDPGQHERAGTHGARLDRHREGAARQPPAVAEPGGRGPKRKDLSVCGGVAEAFPGV